MAIPDFQTLMLPLLRLAGDGQEHTIGAAVDRLASEFHLTEAERAELLPSGKQARFDNRVGWAGTYLRKAGLLRTVGRGRFQVTEQGRNVLAHAPATIDVSFLKTLAPDMLDYRSSRATEGGEEAPPVFDIANGTWTQRAGVEDRIRAKLERAIPVEATRRAALELLAYVVENADAERDSAWWVREGSSTLALTVGRLLACKVSRAHVQLGVMGPIADQVRTQISAAQEDDEDVKAIPGAILLTFPVERAEVVLPLLKDAIDAFVDVAMARLRREVSLDAHMPEAIAYVSSVVGRALPQPEPDQHEAEAGDDDSAPEEVASREPRIRGRAPIFEHGQRSIASLVSDIEREVIALPDLQRPFVWEDTKVRDLLDSLFLGFPIGTLVLWHTSNEKEARAVGADRPGLRATTLVIDGQQRLTSLFALMRGVEIVGKSGEKRKITIAFRPRDGRFEVADAAIRNDPEFLPNVTELWKVGGRPKYQIRRDLMNALRDKGRAVDDSYEDAVERNLEVAQAISDYRFPTVDIRKTSATTAEDASEEDVSEIFVRINNQGKRLGQADFVLTLLSVFHGKLRDRIEERARSMSSGAIIAIDTQQLLRAACAVAFGRARMSAVYRFLRGVDPITGESDPAGRLKRFDVLDAAASDCMEPTQWRDFLLRVRHAGFVNPSLIASKSAIMNAYAFYIRGRRVGVPKPKLDEMLSRWVFGTLLMARYSASSETIFEQDLARVVDLREGQADAFLQALDNALGERLSGDYWTRSLVDELETQKARAPVALAFRAAQIVLGARALFSDQLLQNLLDPSVDGGRSASEAHHLFPQAWLHGRGVRDRRIVNQVANLAHVGWHENNTIGAQSPAKYVPRFREHMKIDDDAWGRLCAEHALPLGWESLEYPQFLVERRRRMAEVIRVAYHKLGGEADAQLLPPPWFLPGSEAVWQRIVQTERALRAVVRDVYVERYGEAAARRIEEALPQTARETLTRALRARPVGADPLTVVDYLYLAQLPPLLFAGEIWQQARQRFGADDAKQRLSAAIGFISPVRNEIAHVREVAPDRLQRANLACGDILELLRDRARGG